MKSELLETIAVHYKGYFEGDGTAAISSIDLPSNIDKNFRALPLALRKQMPSFAEAYDFWNLAARSDQAWAEKVTLEQSIAYVVRWNPEGTDGDVGFMEVFSETGEVLGACEWQGCGIEPEWSTAENMRNKQIFDWSTSLEIISEMERGMQDFSGRSLSGDGIY